MEELCQELNKDAEFVRRLAVVVLTIMTNNIPQFSYTQFDYGE